MSTKKACAIIREKFLEVGFFQGSGGIIMAIQGVGGGNSAVTFRQINLQADLVGKQATAEKMAEGVPHVSNFGVETNLGTSHFQKENH